MAIVTGGAAERLGYDALWVADHLIYGKEGAILEVWSTLAFLAGRTSRLALGPIHMANLFRSPALAAKMIATFDVLSGGRLIVFYDSGSVAAETAAYGFPLPDQLERTARLDEALTLLRRL